MPLRLNRVPAGLLSLFAVKSLGRNPQALEENVRMTIEGRNHYYAGLGTNVSQTTQTGVTFANLNDALAKVEVPDNEIWITRLVEVFYVITTAGIVGANYILTPTYDLPGGINSVSLTKSQLDVAFLRGLAVGGNTGQAIIDSTGYLADPIFAEGGSQFYGNFAYGVTGGQVIDVTTRVLHHTIEK